VLRTPSHFGIDWYHPQIAAAHSLVQRMTLGDVKTIEASFSILLGDDTDMRWNAAWGGGNLYDVGCYCVNVCRYFFDGMPMRRKPRRASSLISSSRNSIRSATK
jgi:predicted dehydrogenase